MPVSRLSTSHMPGWQRCLVGVGSNYLPRFPLKNAIDKFFKNKYIAYTVYCNCYYCTGIGHSIDQSDALPPQNIVCKEKSERI